jgi:hypothetical protein
MLSLLEAPYTIFVPKLFPVVMSVDPPIKLPLTPSQDQYMVIVVLTLAVAVAETVTPPLPSADA